MAILDVKTEKCCCCNGSGKGSVFNHESRKWEASGACRHCNGLGIRSYIIEEFPNGFIANKEYI